MRRLALAHAAANVLLLWLGYYWLGVGETRTATLAWSALVALFVIAAACCTYGAPLVYFRMERDAAVARAWRHAARNLLPLTVGALVLMAGYMALAQAGGPGKRAVNALLFAARWVALPALALPLIAAVAAHGWRGFARLGALRRPWAYWIAAPLLVIAGLWLPLRILGWVPKTGNFWIEALSFAARALAAYLLFVAGWLALAFVTSGGNPRFSHEKTAVSP